MHTIEAIYIIPMSLYKCVWVYLRQDIASIYNVPILPPHKSIFTSPMLKCHNQFEWVNEFVDVCQPVCAYFLYCSILVLELCRKDLYTCVCVCVYVWISRKKRCVWNALKKVWVNYREWFLTKCAPDHTPTLL